MPGIVPVSGNKGRVISQLGKDASPLQDLSIIERSQTVPFELTLSPGVHPSIGGISQSFTASAY